MTARITISLLSAAVISVLASSHAKAQEVNYGALEQMFGEPVTTSATGSPQKASQVPANMQIVTSDDIRRSGALTIPDVLQFVAGVDVRDYGPLDSEVSIRGFSQVYSPRLLVLVNGRQVFLDDYGYTAWQAIPVQLSEIRQIEIVRGPASALFGFNAVGGVINIITYDPLYDKTNVANLTMGTEGTLAGSVVSTFQKPGKAGVRISLGGIRTTEDSTDNLAASPSGHPYFNKPFEGSLGVDGRFKPTPRTEIIAEVTANDSNALEEGITYGEGKSVYRGSSAKLGFSADTDLGTASILGYVNEVRQNASEGIQTIALASQIGVLQANDLVKISANQAVKFGVEYRDSRAWGFVYNGATGYQDYAADAMWTWQIMQELSFTNAARIDRLDAGRADPFTPGYRYSVAELNKTTITEPSFNSGLVYQPTDNDTFRLLVGRGVQAPSLVDLGANVAEKTGPFNVIIGSNPYVKASISTNYEIDYDRSLPALSSTLRTAIYYNQTRDLLISGVNAPLTLNAATLSSYSENLGSAEALGGEIGIQGSNTAGWRWNLAYSLEGVRDKTSELPPQIPFDFNNATPTSVVDFGLGYSWEKFETDLQGKWQSRFTDYREPLSTGVYLPYAVSNYVTLNARIGYQLTPKLELAVAGQQLQGAQTIETAGMEAQRRVLFSATYGF